LPWSLAAVALCTGCLQARTPADAEPARSPKPADDPVEADKRADGEIRAFGERARRLFPRCLYMGPQIKHSRRLAVVAHVTAGADGTISEVKVEREDGGPLVGIVVSCIRNGMSNRPFEEPRNFGRTHRFGVLMN
jgi:hypothetical protein